MAVISSASPAWAWGDLGHKIVCDTAFQELNDSARNAVTRLIVLHPAFDAFPESGSSSWVGRGGWREE